MREGTKDMVLLDGPIEEEKVHGRVYSEIMRLHTTT